MFITLCFAFSAMYRYNKCNDKIAYCILTLISENERFLVHRFPSLFVFFSSIIEYDPKQFYKR